MSPQKRLLLSALAVLAVVLTASAGYMLIESEHVPSFLDALYMTVITVSTVGFGEVFPLSPAGRIWTITTIAFGVATVTYTFSSIVSLLVSGELRSQQVRKRMQKQIDTLRNHVIVVGYGRMGSLVVEELRRRGLPLVVIESDPAKEPQLQNLEVPCLIEDATAEGVLERAGLQRAKGLVLVLPSDADNVYVTLAAHTLFPHVPIIARAELLSTEPKLRRAGADRVICPQVIGATKVANLLTRPSVVDFVEVADQGVDLEIDEYRVPRHSALVGKSLRETGLRERTGATIVAVKRADGQTLVSPDPNAVLQPDDILILVGSAGVSDRLDKLGLSNA
ncbi:MAG: potassium channel protein [Planctomycetota bacterium]|nr:MAG: potassium channel protein [Planctomycetota bacterium]